MARKRKSGGFKLFLLALFSVFVIWVAAFLVWLFWADIEKLTGFGETKTATEQTRPNGAKEKISEEDRKKLEEILKQKK